MKRIAIKMPFNALREISDEDEAEGSDDEEESELDPDNEPVVIKPTRPPKKSGPKELAAEHAKHVN